MSSGRGALLQHLMIKCTHQWVVTNSNATAAELAICNAFKKKNTNNPKEQKMSPGGFKSEKIYSLTVCVCVCVCVLHYSFHRGRALRSRSKSHFFVYTVNKFPYKYRGTRCIFFFADTVKTDLIKLPPGSSFYMCENCMKEHLQKQRLQRLCYKREWAQFDRGRRSFSPRVSRMRKRLLVLMSERGSWVQEFKVQTWLR